MTSFPASSCNKDIVSCKYKKDPIKNNWEKIETPFSAL